MKINWDKIDPLIGTMPDSRLAEQYGVSHTTIANRRRKLGITRKAPQRESAIRWELYDDRLGGEPDTDIATDAGCAKATVYRRRLELGIPAYDPTGRGWRRAPQTAPAPQNLNRYVLLSQAADATGYSTGYLAQLCREAGAAGSLIPEGGARRLGGEWEILRSLLPDLARRKRGENDGRMYIVDVARTLGVTHQRASALFRSRQFAVHQDQSGRRYTTQEDLSAYLLQKK